MSPQRLALDPRKVSRYPVYPFADGFRKLDFDAFEGLCADIKANGQQEPIVIAEGVLIDGRNRLAACLHLKRQVIAVVHDKLDVMTIATLIMTKNVLRRHMTANELAVAVIEFKKVTGTTESYNGLSRQFGVSRSTVFATLNAMKRAASPDAVKKRKPAPKPRFDNWKTLFEALVAVEKFARPNTTLQAQNRARLLADDLKKMVRDDSAGT